MLVATLPSIGALGHDLGMLAARNEVVDVSNFCLAKALELDVFLDTRLEARLKLQYRTMGGRKSLASIDFANALQHINRYPTQFADFLDRPVTSQSDCFGGMA